MNIKQFKSLQLLSCKEDFITVSDIEEISEKLGDRTLLFGNTKSKFLWHVYYKDNKIHRLIYHGKNIVNYKFYEKVKAKELIPSSKMYPECCDYDFCYLLLSIGIDLPFSGFDSTNYKKRIFYGMVKPLCLD